VQPPRAMFLCRMPGPRRFVFCRQRQDERLKRGGEQKSVVVVSSYPYSSVLSQLVAYTGPLYFNHGAAVLEEVRCHSRLESPTGVGLAS
jgi:hypothetical protein